MLSQYLRFSFVGAIFLLISISVSGCSNNAEEGAPNPQSSRSSQEVAPNSQKLITILGTNDIHGGIEPQVNARQQQIGGLAFFAGAVRSVRAGLRQKYGENAGVLVLDAGDQFQGTLISNYNEGNLIFSAMNEVGYDAAITGNHDYDFGPVGWLVDQVPPESPDQNSRGALEHLAASARFPILSANTYLKASIRDVNGQVIPVDSVECRVSGRAHRAVEIIWAEAKRPEFLKPYVIKLVAGVRVALIGIDNPQTPTTTTAANVSDLCFRDEYETYRELRQSLQNQADIFIMIVHDGNSSSEFGLTQLVRRLDQIPGGGVDAVIAGHTHFVNNVRVNGVAAIQSGSGGERFGRIDLTWNTETHSVDRAKTKVYAGVRMDHLGCDEKISDFCSVRDGETPIYEGIPVVQSQKIIEDIIAARQEIAPLASRVIGVADAELTRNRISESPLADAISDVFRAASDTEIAFVNTGGLRDTLPRGQVTYEDLFKVIPFNNHGLTIGPMTWNQVKALLQRSITTCGEFGALMQSGLKVRFNRNCSPSSSIDRNAQLIHVETVWGEQLFDRDTQFEIPQNRPFTVATLDFLAAGGSGFSGFLGTPIQRDLGILREILTAEFLAHPGHWAGTVDNRWSEGSVRQ